MTDNNNENLINSQRFWSKLEGRQITIEETKEYNRNLAAYFDLLNKWDVEVKNKAIPASESQVGNG